MDQRRNHQGNRKHLETNENKAKYQKLWNIAKAVQREDFIAIHASLRKKKDFKRAA